MGLTQLSETSNKFDGAIDTIRGLRNEAFTSQEYFLEEQRRLYASSWSFAIAKSQIPSAGDIVPVTVGSQPLIMVRTQSNEIKAFMNVCPHRGSRLVSENVSGKRSITCPYHSWSFDLEGTLRNRQNFYGMGKHDKTPNGLEGCELFEVRCDSWNDWVFVDLGGKCAPLSEWIAPIATQTEKHRFDAFRLSRTMTFGFDCNWKLAVENYMDAYHVFRIHPDLDSFQVPESRSPMSPDGMCLMNSYRMSRDARGEGLPVFPGLENHTREAMFGVMFPTFGYGLYPSSMAMSIFVPISVNRTEMHMLFYYVGDAADSEEYAAARELNENTWVELNAEDDGICVELQKGREAAAYDGGRFSPYWDAGTVHFTKLSAEIMGET